MTNRDKSDKTQASLHNKRASLSEVNRSITVTQSRSFWRNFLLSLVRVLLWQWDIWIQEIGLPVL